MRRRRRSCLAAMSCHELRAMSEPARLLMLPPGALGAAPCRQLVTDAAHPPRATNIHELRALQKARAERDAAAQDERAASLSETLASRARRVSNCTGCALVARVGSAGPCPRGVQCPPWLPLRTRCCNVHAHASLPIPLLPLLLTQAGPRVIWGQPGEYVPTSPRTTADRTSGFVKASSGGRPPAGRVCACLWPGAVLPTALEWGPRRAPAPGWHGVQGSCMPCRSAGPSHRLLRVVLPTPAAGHVGCGAQAGGGIPQPLPRRALRKGGQLGRIPHVGSVQASGCVDCRWIGVLASCGLCPACTTATHWLSPRVLLCDRLAPPPAWLRRLPPLPQALQYEHSSHIVAGGALATISGAMTGRRRALQAALVVPGCATLLGGLAGPVPLPAAACTFQASLSRQQHMGEQTERRGLAIL